MDEVKLFTVFTLSSATADNMINTMKIETTSERIECITNSLKKGISKAEGREPAAKREHSPKRRHPKV